MIKKIKDRIANKRGASIMEFFILTVVILLIGAVVFQFGKSVKDGVEKGKGVVDSINGNIG